MRIKHYQNNALPKTTHTQLGKRTYRNNSIKVNLEPQIKTSKHQNQNPNRKIT